jgi:RNA polymerase sigma-70 factor (ECF subfamily)
VGREVEGVEAFEAFAGREWRALLALAWSLTGDRATAEDLAQDALEKAWRHWDRVGGYDKPGAWARRVVANQATDRGRRRDREARALRRLDGLDEVDRRATPAAAEPPDAGFWAAVRALPERQAQVVALHYLEDRSVADIAAVLNISDGAVKTHLHRGRLALARALGPTEEAPR